MRQVSQRTTSKALRTQPRTQGFAILLANESPKDLHWITRAAFDTPGCGRPTETRFNDKKIAMYVQKLSGKSPSRLKEGSPSHPADSSGNPNNTPGSSNRLDSKSKQDLQLAQPTLQEFQCKTPTHPGDSMGNSREPTSSTSRLGRKSVPNPNSPSRLSGKSG